MIDEKVLIERLEEHRKEVRRRMGMLGPTIDLVGMDGTFIQVIQDVNQLAEEYKPCNKPSCKDCEVYDKEKHYCPKWCDVIKHTTSELAEEHNNGWIPCSERLPNKRDWYLAVFQEVDTGFIGLPYIADYLMGKHTNYTTEDGWIIANCTDIEEDRAEYYKKLKCIAWQPLPAPYQPKEDK